MTLATLTREAPALTVRAASLTPATIDEAAREITVVAATGGDVQRGAGRQAFVERLDISAVDPDALIGAPLLREHRNELDAVIGVVVAAWVEGDRLMARVRIDDAAIWKRVRSGALRSVSIGYEVGRWAETREEGRRVLTAVEWTPRELSIVAVGADRAAIVRSKKPMALKPKTKPARRAPPVRTRAQEEEDQNDAANENGDDPEDDDTEEREGETDVGAVAAQIIALAESLQLGRAWAADQIAAGVTLESARVAAADALRTRRTATPARRASVGPSNDDPAVRAERMGEALFARTNASHQLSEPARAFAHASLADLARMSLRHAGQSTTGLSPDTLITRALGTSDFPIALGNFTNRELRAGYDAAPSALRQVARETTARDFRAKQKIQVETNARLEKVNELGEYSFGGMVEAAESYRIDTYGKLISISRQTLVNDDLGWTADLARGLGREAARFEAGFLVDLLESGSGFGPNMSDTEALFDAAHGNLSVAAALDQTPLDLARTAMRKQRTLSGDVLGIGPKWLIVPADLETVGEKLLASITPASISEVNPFSNLTLLVEPRLTSATRFYLVADPAQCEGLEYAYLAGAPGPQTETKVGFEVDGVSVKVRLDYGAGFVDWRGWHMNPGASGGG